MKDQIATLKDFPYPSLLLEKILAFCRSVCKPSLLRNHHRTHESSDFTSRSHFKTFASIIPSDKTSDTVSFLKTYAPTIFATVRIAILNIDLTFAWANEKFCAFLEFDAHELIGKRVDSLNLVWEDGQFFPNIFGIISKGLKWSGEIKSQTKDGRESWMKTNIIPIRNNNDQVESYLVLNSDITATKTALEEKNEALKNLILSEARYRALVDNQSDLMLLCKADGTIMFANQSFCQFMGKTLDELVGTKIRHFPLKGIPWEYTKLLLSITPKVPEVFDVFEMQSVTSEKIWVSLCVKGLFDNAGNLYEILVVGRDISELKKAELQKNNYIRDLERIAFMTSHNVRGPIATMLGLIELLRMNAIHTDQWNEILGSFKKCIIDLDVYTTELGDFINYRQASK